MAKPRKKIAPLAKARIIEACGHKCANPGCHTRRMEIHHIREWAIWETNDEEHLVALCPTCHDSAHHGKLKLDDAMLYRWKTFARAKPTRDVFRLETGPTNIFCRNFCRVHALEESERRRLIGTQSNCLSHRRRRFFPRQRRPRNAIRRNASIDQRQSRHTFASDIL